MIYYIFLAYLENIIFINTISNTMKLKLNELIHFFIKLFFIQSNIDNFISICDLLKTWSTFK